MTTSPRLTAAVQGFRTYPSFLHFLASVTLLAAYVSVVCIRGLVFAFSKPHAIVRTQHRTAEIISRTFLFNPERNDARAHAFALFRRVRIRARLGFLPLLPHLPRSVRLLPSRLRSRKLIHVTSPTPLDAR
jgi:hypothetical protein